MRRTKAALFIAVLMAISALSGAQDYKQVDSEDLIAILQSRPGAMTDIKAMKTLSMRRDPNAVSLIIQRADSPYLNVRLNALRALARYHDPNLLPFFEDIILDPQNLRTANERIVAVKAYVTIPGFDEQLLKDALAMAENPIERAILGRAINGEPFHPEVLGQ